MGLDQHTASSTSDIKTRLQSAVGDRYRIGDQIGEGGMAIVILAEDLKHHRKVAIKVVRESLAHTIGIARFLQEIDVIARLQHPHLLTLIDSGEVDGVPYYVMPYLEAMSLRELLSRDKRLPINRAVTIACEVADGLQFAHDHGIVHRDIKPSNVLMSGGHAVVADFGIATAIDKAAMGRLTETGISLGSPTYMSPEQASAEPELDARTDIYSLGCVLYEMLCGEPPVDGPSMQAIVTRKLTGRFSPVRALRPEVPVSLDAAVQRALSTEKEGRFSSAKEFADAMSKSVQLARPATSRTVKLARAAVVLIVIASLGFWLRAERRALWASQQISEINRLTSDGQYAAAYALGEKVGAVIPNDTALARLRSKFADFVRVVTIPSGARVLRQRIGRPDEKWELLGTTPLDSIPMPKSGLDLTYHIRVEKEGFITVDILPNVLANWAVWRRVTPIDTLRLDEVSHSDPEMIRIPGWNHDRLHEVADTIPFGDYFIGRNEVTNREYKEFVAKGGYENRQYWTEPFILDGRTIPWEEAISRLRDRTGMPGPSTWSGGSFPEGQADFPVGGVSYYEAAAYARFAGKSLPTSAHWGRAAFRYHREASWVYMPSSNLNASGPRRVGLGAMNEFGLYDVAGNVREWCVNPLDSGRLTRGAGWDDADFLAVHLIPKSEFDRSPSNGFRLMQTSDDSATLLRLSRRITRPIARDFSKVASVSDKEFAIYRRLYDYDPLPLNAHRDKFGQTEQYRWEKVSFSAAYDGERMAAYLFLPKTAKPPYQAVIYWPGSNALTQRSFDPNQAQFLSFTGFIPRSGRILVLPLYKGSYERDDSAFSISRSQPDATRYYRDLAIRWVKDFRRTVDYLQSRPDIFPSAIGFYGYSWGGLTSPLALAIEPRIRAAVLNTGGLAPYGKPLAELEAVNYLPRVHTPTLMLNGRHDVVFPYENSQLPFFRMLGTPAADKKHIVYPTSHTVPQADNVRETLAWFDKYLNPLTRSSR
jgi:dienelactone hydrolase